ncbi:MAG: hypothetical protein NVS4B12_19940 [Ktedonobacteraceae bacterium]
MYANDRNSHSTIFDEDAITFSDLEPDEEQNASNSLQKIGSRLFKHLGIKVITHPALKEDEGDECDFDIRMTDVPEEVLEANVEPDLLEVRLATMGKRIWQHTPRKRLVASLLLIVLLTLFVSISSLGNTLLSLFPVLAGTSQSKQAVYFNRGSTFDAPVDGTEENFFSFGLNNAVKVTARSIPPYCPSGTMLGQRRQVGNFPVWLSDIGTAATIHLHPLVLNTIRDWKGWIVPLHLEGKYKYVGGITLTVVNIYGTSIPLLQDPRNTVTAPRLFIDTQYPMSITGANGMRQIGIWDIALYLPGAGCYGISASWGQGHWLVNFAAGQ